MITSPEDELASKPLHPSLSTVIVDTSGYEGISERIKGFRRIQEATRDVPDIGTVSPLILMTEVYNLYKTGLGKINFVSECLFDALDGINNPLIVRRLFPDQQGECQRGPRSANISSPEQLKESIISFYRFFEEYYRVDKVVPEIMVHRVIDVTNPLKDPESGLPFPGGDVIELAKDEFQIRATFGADESVQGYPADIWHVAFRGDKKAIVTQTEASNKTHSLVPSTDNYQEIIIPQEFQQIPALNLLQVLSLAQVCRTMSDKFGSHRLEFDGTRLQQRDRLVIIEAAPFTLIHQKLTDPIKGPVQVFEKESDFQNLEAYSSTIVHLSSEYFQGNHKREALTLLSAIAAEKKSRLAVLASGNIATQHAARVLTDSGNIVIFVGEETFQKGEVVEIASKDGEIAWERENQISYKGELAGKREDKIGGKALGLHKLEQNGFKVPKFAVLETSFLNRLIDDLDLTEALNSLDSLPLDKAERVAEELSNQIKEYSGAFAVELQKYSADIAKLFNTNAFSVRSSATCEDGHFSFAGIFETRLNVNQENVSRAVLDVLASRFSPQAIRTMRSLNLKPSEVGIAVIIQEMIKAKYAGTIFTKDIVSGNPDLLRIDAVAGNGELIVDGNAKTHQTLIVNKERSEIVSDEIYNDSGGILSKDKKEELIQIGMEIEKKFREGPQDIEWIIDPNDKLIIVQARVL